MTQLNIAVLGNPILKEPAQTVEALTSEIRQLIQDMSETVYPADGVGLAAPQVGQGLRIFVADEGIAKALSTDEAARDLKVFINPEIIEESDDDEMMEEGCLSLPDIRGDVWRPKRIRFRARDGEFHPVEFEAEGFWARVLMHETDHLNGVLFVDRMSKVKRMTLTPKLVALRRRGRRQTPPEQIPPG